MNEFIYVKRVYYDDTDAGGVVYHANYLKFMAQARSEWLLSFGCNAKTFEEQDFFFVVRSAELDFLKPARLYDELEIISRVVHFGRVSMHYEHIIRATENPTLIFYKGLVKIVCVNSKIKPRALPTIILSGLQS